MALTCANTATRMCPRTCVWTCWPPGGRKGGGSSQACTGGPSLTRADGSLVTCAVGRTPARDRQRRGDRDDQEARRRRERRPLLDKPGEQNGDDAGDEYSVKGACAADGHDRGAEAAHLRQVGQVSA